MQTNPRVVLSVVLSAALFPSLTPAQQWQQRLTGVTPPWRQQHAVAFDAARGETVVFGGNQVFGNPPADTWTWNGTAWTQHAVPGPSIRNDTAMAYDRLRGVVVLFGGAAGATRFQDTWEWNGSQWGPRLTPTVPTARYGHGLAFDGNAGGILMFGGIVQPPPPGPETWVYNGTNWTQLTPSANPPSGGDLTMTTRNGSAVANFSAGAAGMVTWEFDGRPAPAGNRWLNIGAPFTTLSFGECISIAPQDRLVVVVDKSLISSVPMEVYELSSGTWTLRGTVTAPPSGRTVRTAFDSNRDQVVMFSGGGIADTWEFDNNARLATVLASGTGCGQPALTIAAFPGDRPLVGGSFRTDVLGVPAGGAQMALGFSKSMLGPFTLPLPLGLYGMPGCTAYHDTALLLFPTMMSTGTTTAQHTFSIVNARALLGVRFYLQAWAPDPTANAGGLVTSNLLELGLGNY